MNTEKIDHRRNYILVLDTETANTLTNNKGQLDMSNVLVYDCGWIIADTKGNIYKKRSYINADVFYGCADVMKTAYYADKLPRYLMDIYKGKRLVEDTMTIRQIMLQDIADYGIKYVCAHNARFDYNALNTTLRFITKGTVRNWFPFGTVEWWDSLKMARQVLLEMPTYKKFCDTHGYKTATGKYSATAENCYKFIINDPSFIESHTGLEDVLIEYAIMMYCYRQHKKMEKRLFTKSFPENTKFQNELWWNLKEIPMIPMGAE